VKPNPFDARAEIPREKPGDVDVEPLPVVRERRIIAGGPDTERTLEARLDGARTERQEEG
jgi:hypothetical protein